jgi:hypothetical protein
MSTALDPTETAAAESTTDGATARNGPVRIDKSLVELAKLGDHEALQKILRQFIDVREPIEFCEYLGTLGIPPFGLKSFAVLTPRRIGALRIGWFGYVQYQDAPLEYTVSGLIEQPSLLSLYLWLASVTVAVLAADVFAFLVLPPLSGAALAAALLGAFVLSFVWVVTVRLFYALRKCGLLWAVREGLWIYAFTNRGLMNVANRLHRRAIELREQRVRDVRPVA